ncbi:Carrier protein, mitochondrial [Mycoemilia scoparia]|uniref:Carrier protein, mitochondrial n=1 Tax=Mycoemilia scoparia TaxID=417184 RepID=A0A9W8A4R1_9FUNG|nr:Carrier protein, mitochondrial [Mycoemilia scoparia]
MPTEPALSTLSMASQTSEDIYVSAKIRPNDLTKEGHNESSGVTRPSSPNTCKSTQIEPKLTEKIFSACSGAIVTSCLMTPFDVVKTRLQSQSLNIRPTGPTQASIVKINPSTMSTISQCAPNFFIPPATDGYCFCVQQFASSSQIQKSSTSCVFHGWNVGKPSVMGADGWRHFGRSSFGSSIERTLEGKEVIPKFNGTLDGMMQISRNEGLKSLWRGLSPTLMFGNGNFSARTHKNKNAVFRVTRSQK